MVRGLWFWIKVSKKFQVEFSLHVKELHVYRTFYSKLECHVYANNHYHYQPSSVED